MIELKNGYIVLNGVHKLLLSGEFHYWRHNPYYWEKILDAIKYHGLEFISTYIPWNFHEIGSGEYDFTGKTNPSRDLENFIRLTEKKGFYLILRPGPYIYGEWVNGGPPDDVIIYHRMHSKFIRRAEEYIRNLCKIIVPHQYTFNGNIVLIQIDNEIDLWPWRYGRQLGLREKPGLFQEWIKNRYKDIHKLNEKWNTDYDDFSEVKVFEKPSINYLPRYVDYRLFKDWYCGEYLVKIRDLFIKYGINIPFISNVYDIDFPQNVKVFYKRNVYPFMDIYLKNMVPWRNLIGFIVRLKYYRAIVSKPFSTEFQCGIWHAACPDTDIIEPAHHRYMSMLALMYGLAGWNWYMFVGRDNWFFTPIDEIGRIRIKYSNEIKHVVKMFRKIVPPMLRDITNTSIFFTDLCRWGIGIDKIYLLSEVLLKAGIDFNIYESEVDRVKGKLILFIAPQHLFDKDAFRLLKLAENGAKIVFFHDIPRRNIYGEELKIFNELVKPPKSINDIRRGYIVLENRGEKYFVKTRYITQYTDGDIIGYREPLQVEFKRDFEFMMKTVGGEKFAVGKNIGIGSGSITLIGLDPSPTLLKYIHSYFNIPLYIHVNVSGVLGKIYEAEDEYILFLANTRAEDMGVSVKLELNKLGLDMVKIIDLDDEKNMAVVDEKKCFFATHILAKSIKIFRLKSI